MRLVRFGVSMHPRLLDRFDRVIANKGYENRSEAIRDLIRDYLVQTDWEEDEREVAGTITLIYNHHVRGLTDVLIDLQHEHYCHILCSSHVHLDQHNCLEVLVVKGPAGKIKTIADRLISVKGVVHGSLSITSTGRDLPA
ncbi:MAG: nickel-responsive transcriptional regulator NikR [Limnochordia bacterium]|nr:nickel-responsive transcriptional regulator NikR [Bacillota bacterium]